MDIKPTVKLTGQNGNVYNIISLVSSALRKAGLRDKEKEWQEKAFKADSYDEVLQLCFDYVEPE